MNSNLPKFAMVMTSNDEDVKRSTREVRAELQGVADEAVKSAPAFDAQAQAAERAAAASRDLAKAAELGATAAHRTIAGIGASADAALPSMERLVNAFAGITAPAANRNGRMADIEAYGQKLDQLQAKFDPLFAAQQRYQQKLAEIAEAERFGAISASAAIDQRIRETNSYNALINNMDRLAMARKAAAEGMVARQTITPDREADITSFFDQRDAARARHDPRFAVLTAYREKLSEIRKDLRAGAIDQDVATAAIQRHRQAALATVAALKGREGAGGMGGNDRYRVQNLGYQVFDSVQTTALGMPLAMVAMQQLPQVIQLYAGQGGMNAAVKDFGTIASGAAKLVTPLTIGIGGLAAVVGTGLVAWNGYLKSTKEVETAATGLGRAVAGSAQDMERAAQNGASVANISVASARSMEAQFLRTGRIGSEHFEELIGLSKDFGATVGIGADEAGQALADMFADPAKAAQVLYQQYGLIDAATARQATNLARQNRQSEAQAVLLDALPDRLASASEATTSWGRLWETVGTKAGNTLDYIGSKLDEIASGPSLDQQLAIARARAEGINSDIVLRNLPFLADNANGNVEQLASDKELRDYEEAKRKRDAENIMRSQRVRSIADASGANDRRLRIETLQNDIRTLEDGQSLPNRDAALAERDASALEAKQRVLEALTNQQARLNEIDRLDIQIQNERNPLVRADLAARRTRLELSDKEMTGERLAAEAGRARNRIIQETIAAGRSQASDMQVELEARTRINSLVASGAITIADANRMLQEELTLRPLIAAATSAEGEAKQALQQIVGDLKTAYAGLAEQEKLASAQQYVRGQQEKLEQLRLEHALIGQNDSVRGRAIARLEVEQDIRRRGLDTHSALAKLMRDNADAMAQLNNQVERQAEAWDKVRGSGESAIDSIFEAAAEGDFDDLLETISKDFSKTLLELGGANPLKNALLGTDHATLSDVGGLGGIFKRLMGGGEADPASLVSKAIGQNVGAMTVTAGTVMINGGVGGLPGLGNPLSGANDNIGGSGEKLAWDFWKSKGLEDHQVAGVLGNIKAESAFNPLAVGDGGNAFGLYQHNDRRNNLFAAIGGRENLSDALGQHKFAYSELMGPENRAWQALLASKNTKDATAAFAGFERPSGFSWGNPEAAHNFVGRLNGANEALATFGGKTSVAAEGLGTLGSGFGQLGSALSSGVNGGAAGSGGGLLGWLGSLFGGGGNAAIGFTGANSTLGSFLTTGFLSGGPTGGSDPNRVAGLVHEKEFVFDAQSTAALGVGNLDALRRTALRGGKSGYQSGGVVSSASWSYPAAASDRGAGMGSARNAPIINNYGNNEVNYEETTDERGNRQPIITIGEHVAAALGQPGNPARTAMKNNFGARPRRISR